MIVAVLEGIPAGIIGLFIVGPMMRIAIKVMFGVFNPVRAYDAIRDSTYRGLMVKSLIWGLILCGFFFLISSGAAGDQIVRGYAIGGAIGMMLAWFSYSAISSAKRV